MLYTLGLESNVSYIRIYYIDDEISFIIIIQIWTTVAGMKVVVKHNTIIFVVF